MEFERGCKAKPRGHAVVYWEYLDDPTRFLTIYIVVHPLQITPLQLEQAADIMGIEYPPEKARGLEELKRRGIPLSPVSALYPTHITDLKILRRVAEDRDDDLVNAGVLYPLSDLRKEIMKARDEYHILYTNMIAEDLLLERDKTVKEVEEFFKEGLDST